MFIGDKEIEKVDDFDVEGVRVNISFKDNTSQVMTKLLYDVSVSEEAIDASTLRDNQCQQVTLRIMKLLLDWDIEIGNVQYITSILITSITQWEKEGDVIKWGKNKNKVLMSELDKVLKQI